MDQLSQTAADAAVKPALAGLVVMAHYHGIAVSPSDILHRFAVSGGIGGDLTESEWLLAAKDLQLKAKVVRQPLSRLPGTALPAMVWCEDGAHFVLARVEGSGETASYLIQDLQGSQALLLNAAEFAGRYSGRLILVASRASVLGSLAKFDFT